MKKISKENKIERMNNKLPFVRFVCFDHIFEEKKFCDFYINKILQNILFCNAVKKTLHKT